MTAPFPERRRPVTRWQHTTPPLPMTAFARANGVSASTFSRWVQDPADVATARASVELTPAEPEAPQELLDSGVL
ncbi:MAG: hypothetical protein JXX28_00240 [Deltaproteobacteria bacterium]|nr:hypothetical protein [Deltaproteobacteria bacterium]